MDKKGILGIVVCAAGLVGWQFYYQHEYQKAVQAQREAALLAPAAPVGPGQAPVAAEAALPGAPNAPAVGGVTTTIPPSTAAPAPSSPPEGIKVEKLASKSVEYAFSNMGGGIAQAKLLTHNSEGDRKVVLNEFGKIPIGTVSEIAGEGMAVPYEMKVNPTAGEVLFERTDSRQIQTKKRFLLPKIDPANKDAALRQEYLVRMELTFTNNSAQPVQIPVYFVHTGAAAPIHQRDMPIYTGFDFFREGTNKLIDSQWFSGGSWFSRRPASPVYSEAEGKVRWAGVTDQYFTSLTIPEIDDRANSDEQAKHYGSQVWAKRFVVEDPTWVAAGRSLDGKGKLERFAVDGAIGMPGATLQPGQSLSQAFEVFTGPREYRTLSAVGHNVDEMMNFGMFSIVSKTLLNSMNTLRAWLGNYAWAIVVLTLGIKTLLWPLQNKATSSMKKMQALQPLMTELKAKYKDDPTRMNTELMKLYKEYKINPLSGCFPMLIQIPIFFGFYSMLGKAVELRNSQFLWVHDLSQPDTVGHLMDFPINVLPLCMAVTMLVQMTIQPKSGDPAQQRMFMFMPLIFVYFCYNFASALALYWTVQNIFSIVQLLATRNQAAPVLIKPAAPSTKRKNY